MMGVVRKWMAREGVGGGMVVNPMKTRTSRFKDGDRASLPRGKSRERGERILVFRTLDTAAEAHNLAVTCL